MSRRTSRTDRRITGSPPRRARRPGAAAIAALGVLAALGALIVAPTAASAQGCSALDRLGTRCRLANELNPARPRPGGGPVITSSSPPGPVFKWLNLLVACDAAGSSGWTPMNDLASAILDLSLLTGGPAATEPGVLWIGELVDPATGGTNAGYISCVGVGDGPPPLPPPVPTADQIWGAALTFEPDVHLDPFIRGLTGLETFMWYEGPLADSVTLTLNGYDVTADIAAVEFRWDMGGASRAGQRIYASGRPGSPDAPAATHTYARPDHSVVIHEIVWTGTSVLTGPGLPPGGVTVDLGQAVLATARAYDVIEVRTPLVRGPGKG